LTLKGHLTESSASRTRLALKIISPKVFLINTFDRNSEKGHLTENQIFFSQLAFDQLVSIKWCSVLFFGEIIIGEMNEWFYRFRDFFCLSATECNLVKWTRAIFWSFIRPKRHFGVSRFTTLQENIFFGQMPFGRMNFWPNDKIIQFNSK
jgi:hypothetical protein